MNDYDPNQKARDLGVVTLLLRLAIGMLFLFAGAGKFLSGYPAFVKWMVDTMTAKTWLPAFALYPYAGALPFIEVAVGALLIAGLFTRPVLFGTGLLLISLAFGKVLTQEYDVVGTNINYVFITAVAYYCSRSDPYSLDALLKAR